MVRETWSEPYRWLGLAGVTRGVGLLLPVGTVGKAVGHASESTTSRYDHTKAVDAPVRQAADAIAASAAAALAGESSGDDGAAEAVN